MSWFEFVIGDYFILFWILVVVACVFVPFGIVGIIRFYQWIDEQFLKPKKGYIKVRQKLGNDRWKEFWKRPEGNKIKIKTEEGVNLDVPINLGKDYIGWNGNTPFIEMDENLTQMPLTRTVLTIPREHQTRMSYLAYLAGKIAGMTEKTRLELFLMIAVAVMVGAAAFSIYMSYQSQQAIGTLKADIAALKPTLSVLNQTMQIPRVG